MMMMLVEILAELQRITYGVGSDAVIKYKNTNKWDSKWMHTFTAFLNETKKYATFSLIWEITPTSKELNETHFFLYFIFKQHLVFILLKSPTESTLVVEKKL